MQSANTNDDRSRLLYIKAWLRQALDHHIFEERASPPDIELLLEGNRVSPLQGVDEMKAFTDADGDPAFCLELKKPKELDTTRREFDASSIVALQILGLAQCRFTMEPHSGSNNKFYMRGHFPTADVHRRFDVRRFVADAPAGSRVRELKGYHCLQRKHLSLEAGRGDPSFDAAAGFALERLDELLQGGEELASAILDSHRLADLIAIARMLLHYVPLGRR